MNPLNSPLEVGVRALVLLAETYPKGLDLAQLVVLDHAMLHSGDLHGPDSLHPDMPAQPGALGMKRRLLEEALVVLVRAGLAGVSATREGIEYHATEQGPGFVDILEAPYVEQLRERAEWAVHHYAPAGSDIRTATREITVSRPGEHRQNQETGRA
ncbi:ABC-three component system middle component 2 [Kitasatospora indigofera]|uniref:ABC-three component system middle component 2 n=1 Tax=Kitasatospora indigofera TaxID=67307 RepID=UPI0033B4B82B